MRLQRISLDRPRSRRKLARRQDVERLRQLEREAGVVPVKAIWAGDVKDAIRRLEQYLQHRRQPSLFEKVGRG